MVWVSTRAPPIRMEEAPAWVVRKLIARSLSLLCSENVLEADPLERVKVLVLSSKPRRESAPDCSAIFRPAATACQKTSSGLVARLPSRCAEAPMMVVAIRAMTARARSISRRVKPLSLARDIPSPIADVVVGAVDAVGPHRPQI